nr:NAD(P)H-hydrate epimerase [Corynebacterium lactis]
MTYCYTVAEIRAAEQPYLDAQSRDDELMSHAAAAVAEVAADLAKRGRILLLVGSGGNGGDALYAGRELLVAGHEVDAVLLGGHPHERALVAFEGAGGEVLDDVGLGAGLGGELSAQYSLVIDGIVGIGGHGSLREPAASIVERVRDGGVPILAVDIPSGVEADTGREADTHVRATATVTFGGLRYAHAVSGACGEVVLREIALDEPTAELPGLGETLRANAVQAGGPRVAFLRALEDSREHYLQLEPDAEDHKYSGGVVGIAAGSSRYPGAGVLCTTAAVRATSPAVIYVGDAESRARMTTALPTVIARADTEPVADTRVDAWVVGPGRGTDIAAAAELRAILDTGKPVVIDADALTVLARSEDLKEQVRKRGAAGARTVLTPHAGEYERLAGKPVTAPIDDARVLASDLGCEILLKGRRTVTVGPRGVVVVDAGSSWAATPGSGDVLSGLVGAWIARGEDLHVPAIIHARAAYLAARTEFGPAPCDAEGIAENIRPATAWLAQSGTRSGE